MSISQHELHVLEPIGDQLTVSDPELAGLMAIFARLTASEEMPASDPGQRPILVVSGDSKSNSLLHGQDERLR
jgi:hypothetical protein